MEKKLAMLRELDEDRLRTEVYLPMLRKISKIQHVEERHGSREMGVDVTFYEEDAFGIPRLMGAQLKVTNIDLSAKSPENIQPLINQAKTALGVRHKNVITKRREFLTTLYIVTTGRISDQAKEVILDQVENKNVSFIDGQELLNQIETHFPEYFKYSDKLARTYFSAVKSDVARIPVFGPGRLEERDLSEFFVSPMLGEGPEGYKTPGLKLHKLAGSRCVTQQHVADFAVMIAAIKRRSGGGREQAVAAVDGRTEVPDLPGDPEA